MSRSTEKDVICPYFREMPSNGYTNSSAAQMRARENWAAKRIRCEGVVAAKDLTLTFDSVAERVRHKKRFCASYCYNECPIAKLLNQKYGVSERDD